MFVLPAITVMLLKRSATKLLWCNLLENRSYESFKERGLDEVRQKLRYEHFEDKRLLKTRAVENVLLSSNKST